MFKIGDWVKLTDKPAWNLSSAIMEIYDIIGPFDATNHACYVKILCMTNGDEIPLPKRRIFMNNRLEYVTKMEHEKLAEFLDMLSLANI